MDKEHNHHSHLGKSFLHLSMIDWGLYVVTSRCQQKFLRHGGPNQTVVLCTTVVGCAKQLTGNSTVSSVCQHSVRQIVGVRGNSKLLEYVETAPSRLCVNIVSGKLLEYVGHADALPVCAILPYAFSYTVSSGSFNRLNSGEIDTPF